MRWQERQNQIEELIDDTISELEDEIGLLVPYQPTVFWIGRTIKFKDIGLPAYKLNNFHNQLANRESYLSYPNTIILFRNDIEAIREESAHFFHISLSGIRFVGLSIQEIICIRIISEMMALLGSRILGSTRKDNFSMIPDLSRIDDKNWQRICDSSPDYFQNENDFFAVYIYQQGYGLADRIYYKYLTGEVSMSQIRRLFLSKFDGPGEAISAFIKLKNKYWPPPK